MMFTTHSYVQADRCRKHHGRLKLTTRIFTPQVMPGGTKMRSGNQDQP